MGDWVWLHLLHRLTHSLERRPKGKLRPRYAGPFQVIERIGQVAYRLQLSEGLRLHDVFHVGLLKPFHGDPSTTMPPLPPIHDGRVVLTLVRVRRARFPQGAWDILVEWQGLSLDDATWETWESFVERYPDFQLDDELFPKERRDVRAPAQPAHVPELAQPPPLITYQRRRRTSG